ncbi:MAG: DNA mismatch repair protein MutS, partial [Dehalococcoidales bacterium]
GCDHLPLAIKAAGAIIHYLGETQKAVLGQTRHLTTYSTDTFMALDAQTQANLEIFRGGRSGNSAGSLLGVIDLTCTAMGGRRLKRWLGQPLLDIKELNKRQDAVAWFYDKSLARSRTISLLGEVADLERLINRIRSGSAQPGELVSLKRGLEVIPELRGIIEAAGELGWLSDEIKVRDDVVGLLGEAIVEAPGNLGEGGVIRPGFSEELDTLRQASKNARQYLAGLEKSEREKTGIKNLKVGYNRVFGYYIEVSRPNLPQVPPDYIRKQTLINGERYFTADLKEYESLILNVKERMAEMETEIFERICRQVKTVADPILNTARAIADLDVIVSLAEVAVRYNYVCPKLNEESAISITGGRHPAVERNLSDGSFVANDTFLSNEDTAVAIITGPNMSGKSTYLRQVALITLLAQIGSFVPADRATIGLVDRIFTRIGARDDLAAGQSTFMVEMVETANILNNATARSLLILDEIGRGTSTYDGLAIARAVVEYIHNSPELGAKTLFATHYHEMVALADFLPRVKNFNVAVVDEGGRVIFLHKIIPGGVDRSYGIHVAQLAGLPRAVVSRAREVLDELEKEARPDKAGTARRRRAEEVKQLSFMGQEPGDSKLRGEISGLDINSMTPLEAMTKLYELQKKVGEG